MKPPPLHAPRLGAKTDPDWVKTALSSLAQTMSDHAHCEKKAAANALSLMNAYPEVEGLPLAMARLAREEASHLAGVIAHMKKRGFALGRDGGDPYVQELVKLVRTTPKERMIDRLLVAALIEARSEERLRLLAERLEDPELRDFYAQLARTEAGHGLLFVRLAAKTAPREEVLARLHELSAAEGAILPRLPLRAAIH